MAHDVFVTVGMGPYPFDRLVGALGELTERHRVFAQIGTATVLPPCPHVRFMGFDETQRRLADADVVVTHAGNTVRVVQSMGRVPVAVARRASLGEMANDHQVTYLDRERRTGRVVAVDEVSALAPVVDDFAATARRLLAERPARAVQDTETLLRTLDELLLPLMQRRQAVAR